MIDFLSENKIIVVRVIAFFIAAAVLGLILSKIDNSIIGCSLSYLLGAVYTSVTHSLKDYE